MSEYIVFMAKIFIQNCTTLRKLDDTIYSLKTGGQPKSYRLLLSPAMQQVTSKSVDYEVLPAYFTDIFGQHYKIRYTVLARRHLQ